MKTQLTFHGTISELLSRKIESQPTYSLRAFARDIGLSPSFVSRALKGQKRFSSSKLKVLFRVLDVDRETQDKLKNLFVLDRMGQEFRSPSRSEFHNSHLVYKRLPQKKSSLLTQWYYIPVLELLTVANFEMSEEEVASRLRITRTMVRESLEVLKRFDILQEKDGVLKRNHEDIRFASSISRPEIRQYHQSMMLRASEELQRSDPSSFQARLITGITTGANPKKLEAAKGILNDAIHRVSKLLADEQASEVYQINLQLFPLTRK
ncbi:MAG: TIGR02147 family protein [Bdellovibrionales bacterium]